MFYDLHVPKSSQNNYLSDIYIYTVSPSCTVFCIVKYNSLWYFLFKWLLNVNLLREAFSDHPVWNSSRFPCREYFVLYIVLFSWASPPAPPPIWNDTVDFLSNLVIPCFSPPNNVSHWGQRRHLLYSPLCPAPKLRFASQKMLLSFLNE